MSRNTPTQKASGAPDSALLISQIDQELIVSSLQVFGINSLKTVVDPGILTGEPLKAASVEDDRLLLLFEAVEIRVDFQRTGGVQWIPELESAGAPSVSRLPTGRLSFSSGARLDFVEPAKTKRIGFWINPLSA
jgi:hypothetical protein